MRWEGGRSEQHQHIYKLRGEVDGKGGGVAYVKICCLVWQNNIVKAKNYNTCSHSTKYIHNIYTHTISRILV